MTKINNNHGIIEFGRIFNGRGILAPKRESMILQ
jgi:hypothetical protein